MMLVSNPVETIKYQDIVVSYWKIEQGGFYYLTEKQEFRGKYKTWNFIATSNETTILGVDKKNERRFKKYLMRDIISSRY